MKIAILTNFMEFTPGYSLTGIVKDQVRMLSEYGHEVHLFVNSKYHGEEFDPRVVLHKSIPFAHLHDFKSRSELTDPKFQSKEGKPAGYFRDLITSTSEVLKTELAEGFEAAFTHDFMFIGWFMPYGLACSDAGRSLPNVRWLHWVHSVPTGQRDYWNAPEWGPAHRVIYPNSSDRVRVAEAFKGKPADVRVIPHIKDLRTWFDFDQETCDFISEYPAVMQADVVQIYPASVDRLGAKRVREVMFIFSQIKKLGKSVCLVLATQWATGKQQREEIDRYKKIAFGFGLKIGEEVVFSSDWKKGQGKGGDQERAKYDVGLPRNILRELMQCSNLFIFPTKEESFGLVLPEASLSGGALCVLNKSLQQQIEISGYTALYFDFGSFHHTVNLEVPEEKFFHDVAMLILGRMKEDESLNTRTFMRKTYNWDNLYRNYYGPILAESKLWSV
jgi:glycosyltransferase involved in cell wall biosynthesis